MANQRRPSPAKNVKAWITALSVAATVGGWAAISQQGVSATTAVPTTSLAQANTTTSTQRRAATMSRRTSSTVASSTTTVAVTRTRSSR
jgi:hypothetical protein